VALLAEEKPAEAKSHFTAAVSLDPEQHRARFMLGVVLADEGNTGEAEKHFRKAAESPDAQIRDMARDALSKLKGTP
jgi:Flp pilus assembly protein TadD